LTQEGKNNVRLLSAAVVNGFTIVTYQRKLKGTDAFDKSIMTNGSQPVIWAIGPLKNQLAAYHTYRQEGWLDLYYGFPYILSVSGQ